MLSEFKLTFGDVWLSLNWKDDDEGRRFVNALVDSEPNRLTDEFRNDLFKRTNGHPMFTVELLQAMEARGDLIRDREGRWTAGTALDWYSLPARVEAVIEERIRQLDPELQEILSAASVEGKTFTVQVVAAMRQMEEGALLTRLSQDLDRRYGLVKERDLVRTNRQSIVRYRFSHDLFQEFLYQQLSPGERNLAHGVVADTLESLYSEKPEIVAMQLAHHFDSAGDRRNALRYFALAGDHAAGMYANEEAISHYTRAIHLLTNDTADGAQSIRLHHRRGVAFRTTGRFPQAHGDMEIALERAQAIGDLQTEWQVLVDLGQLWASQNYGQARGFFERALAVARQMDDARILASSLNWMGNWHANHEEPAIALSHHQEAMQIFETETDRPNMARTLDLLGITYLLAGNFEESVANYDRSINLFQDLGDLPNLASSLMGRAVTATAPAFLTIVPATKASDPFSDFQEAVEIAQRIGFFSG